MNLGQLIGAYWNALDCAPVDVLAGRLPDARPLAVFAGRLPRTGACARIRQALVLAGAAGMSSREIASAAVVPTHKVCALIAGMPDVEHVGERGAYRYRLKGKA